LLVLEQYVTVELYELYTIINVYGYMKLMVNLNQFRIHLFY